MRAARAVATVGYLRAAVRARTRSAASLSRVALLSGLSGCFSTASPNASVGTVSAVFAAPFGLGLPAGCGRVVTAADPPLSSFDARPIAKPAAAIATAARPFSLADFPGRQPGGFPLPSLASLQS
jgi:hypothetical protein